MSDSPMSIRVPEEIQKLFTELSEKSDFKNKGEFFSYIITQYQLEQVKDDFSLLKPTITAIQEMTNRINLTLIGADEIIKTNEEKYKNQLEKQKESFEETRLLLQQQISSLQQEKTENGEQMQILIDQRDRLLTRENELLQQIKALENTINDKILLIDEYKNKNDTLIGIIEKGKLNSEENKKLKDTLFNLQKNNRELETNINSKQKEITELQEKIQEKENQFTKELNLQKREIELEKELALLELKKAHDIELDKLRIGYNNKTFKLSDTNNQK